MPTSSSGLVSMARNSSGLSSTSPCRGVDEVTGWVMPRLFTTSTTPSMSQASRPATRIRSCCSADPSTDAAADHLVVVEKEHRDRLLGLAGGRSAAHRTYYG